MKYDELVKELRARAWQGRFNIEAADAITTLQAELEQCRKDAERYAWLRKTLESAKGSGSIDVNSERAYYETPEEGKQVRIQWYPDTPVGFYVSEAETIDAAIDKAMESV